MDRTFTLVTSEADEKALRHVHPLGKIPFFFESLLQSGVNAAREELVRVEREQAMLDGRNLGGDKEAIILSATAKDADTRQQETLAKLDEERVERERQATLTARQLRLGLVKNGFSITQVDAALDAMPDGQEKDEAKIEWQYAGEFKRDHPLLMTIAAELGISAEQFDAMWVAAQKL